jgi:uncharacterized protein (TIGR03067 family)
MKKQTVTLEGVWSYRTLQVNGAQMPKDSLENATLAIDGDQFRVESPSETYTGIYQIDTSVQPNHIDIDFKDGPAAGMRRGIFELDKDELKICLGLEGHDRPKAFVSKAGSGHALEVLKRGGKRPAAANASTSKASPAAASSTASADDPELPKLQGSWDMLSGDRDGQPLPASFLNGAKRVAKGDETTVYMGGRVFLTARVRIDSGKAPKQIDYLLDKGKTQLGIYKLEGKQLTFCFAKPGSTRPADFASGSGRTVSIWKYSGEA